MSMELQKTTARFRLDRETLAEAARAEAAGGMPPEPAALPHTTGA